MPQSVGKLWVPVQLQIVPILVLPEDTLNYYRDKRGS